MTEQSQSRSDTVGPHSQVAPAEVHTTLVGLITGITGQDGSYLAELLLEKGYVVYGAIRRATTPNTQRIAHVLDRINLLYADLTDTSRFSDIIAKIEQDHPKLERLEIYNLAAQSHVKVSFDIPEYTTEVDAMGPLRILEAIRQSRIKERIRFYQAGTSEMFGKVKENPQKETTPFNPQSPYGAAKLYAYYITRNYREAYNLFAVCGLLFNHESRRRDIAFVTRKVTIALGKIYRGEQQVLTIGNMDAKRDWGHAKDYVYAMWLMLQSPKPIDYVVSSNETHSVREFIQRAFALQGMILRWEGSGVNEKGYDQDNNLRVVVDPQFFRPTEVDYLLGDSSRIRTELGWKPQYDFEGLLKEMVNNDCYWK